MAVISVVFQCIWCWQGMPWCALATC